MATSFVRRSAFAGAAPARSQAAVLPRAVSRARTVNAQALFNFGTKSAGSSSEFYSFEVKVNL